MEKSTYSLAEAEALQKSGWTVKSISGNPKQYVMFNAEVKQETKEEVKVKNVKK